MNNIKFDKVDFSYDGKSRVFQNFSLNLEPKKPGYVTAIMGSSGSGKSTLLKLILGIEKIQSGELIISPVNPVISYVPQEAVLFEHLSLEKNAKYFQFAGAYKERFNESLYKELLKELGLEDVIEKARSVNEISGGQKQRLTLLRALSINPNFILLDEPCNGLDAEVKRSFLNKLREITEHYGLYTLYITHHKLEAQLIADEVVYLVQDKSTGIVRHSVSAPIFDFMIKPPVLDAAYIFRFPDVKILPVKKSVDRDIEIAANPMDATNYLLIEDENIKFSKTNGYDFKVISKSPLYSVIRHEFSNIEWMISSNNLNGYYVNEKIKVEIIGNTVEYEKDGSIKK